MSLKFGISHSSICASAERFTTNINDLNYRNKNKKKKKNKAAVMKLKEKRSAERYILKLSKEDIFTVRSVRQRGKYRRYKQIVD